MRTGKDGGKQAANKTGGGSILPPTQTPTLLNKQTSHNISIKINELSKEGKVNKFLKKFSYRDDIHIRIKASEMLVAPRISEHFLKSLEF